MADFSKLLLGAYSRTPASFAAQEVYNVAFNLVLSGVVQKKEKAYSLYPNLCFGEEVRAQHVLFRSTKVVSLSYTKRASKNISIAYLIFFTQASFVNIHIGNMLEQMLQKEIDAHLGYAKHSPKEHLF